MGALYLIASRRYLSWIEELTTNQSVIGSNPIRRTRNFQSPARGSFHIPMQRLLCRRALSEDAAMA